MPDNENLVDEKDFHTSIPQVDGRGTFPKGMANVDWGMKNRLSRIFARSTGKTVMLAFDHGYIMGPTSGLERPDLTIPPLIPFADCLMGTRGVIKSVIPADVDKPIALRASAGTTVLTELNDECIIDIEDAIRLNVSAIAVMVAVGSKQYEAVTVRNLSNICDLGNKYGIPVLGVNAVGKELKREWRYLSLATRVIAENGAHIVKTYYCEEGFEKVTAGCPVPIVIAGGKKIPEAEALIMAHKAVSSGAAGVDMGRNVFQAVDPVAMIQAVRAVVHGQERPEKAYQLYQDLKGK